MVLTTCFQSLAEQQLAQVLTERNTYRDRCQLLSKKMTKQASETLEKLSSASTKDSSDSKVSRSHSDGGQRHWSIQTGGIKVLRARGDVTERHGAGSVVSTEESLDTRCVGSAQLSAVQGCLSPS